MNKNLLYSFLSSRLVSLINHYKLHNNKVDWLVGWFLVVPPSILWWVISGCLVMVAIKVTCIITIF